MTLQQAQQQVDEWIKTVGVRYFSELTNMAILTEEVGELASIMARKYGDQSFKESDKDKNMADEMKFEHFATSCIMKVEAGKEPVMLWNPGMFKSFSISPDGQYILVEQLMRPFSYNVPYYRFPTCIDIWTSEAGYARG